jgi:hypothetical protein
MDRPSRTPLPDHGAVLHCMSIAAGVLAALCGFAQPVLYRAVVWVLQRVVSTPLGKIVAVVVSVLGSGAALVPISVYVAREPTVIILAYAGALTIARSFQGKL